MCLRVWFPVTIGCPADFVEVRKSGLNLPAGVSFPVQEVVENGSKKS